MTLQNMQTQQQLMNLILLRQGTNTTIPPTEFLRANADFSKWESRFSFGLYMFRLNTFIANLFPSMAE